MLYTLFSFWNRGLIMKPLNNYHWIWTFTLCPFGKQIIFALLLPIFSTSLESPKRALTYVLNIFGSNYILLSNPCFLYYSRMYEFYCTWYKYSKLCFNSRDLYNIFLCQETCKEYIFSHVNMWTEILFRGIYSLAYIIVSFASIALRNMRRLSSSEA